MGHAPRCLRGGCFGRMPAQSPELAKFRHVDLPSAGGADDAVASLSGGNRHVGRTWAGDQIGLRAGHCVRPGGGVRPGTGKGWIARLGGNGLRSGPAAGDRRNSPVGFFYHLPSVSSKFTLFFPKKSWLLARCGAIISSPPDTLDHVAHADGSTPLHPRYGGPGGRILPNRLQTGILAVFLNTGFARALNHTVGETNDGIGPRKGRVRNGTGRTDMSVDLVS